MLLGSLVAFCLWAAAPASGALAAEPPPVPPETADRIEQLRVMADGALAAGKLDKAAEALQVAIGLDPSVRSWSLRKRLVDTFLLLGPSRCHEARQVVKDYLDLDGLSSEHRIWGEQVAQPRLDAACPAPSRAADTSDSDSRDQEEPPVDRPLEPRRASGSRVLAPALLIVGGTLTAGAGAGLIGWSDWNSTACDESVDGTCVARDYTPGGTALLVAGALTDVVGILVAIAEGRRAATRADAGAPSPGRPPLVRPAGGAAPVGRDAAGWFGVTGAF